MFKTKLIRTAMFILLAAGIAGLFQATAAAESYSKQDMNKITKRCSNKTGIPQKTKNNGKKLVLGACVEGYIIGLETPKDSSACNNAYKGKKDALRACRVTGFELGRSNPDKVKAKEPKGGKDKDKCEGSECTPTPTGSGRNCDDKHCDLISLYVNPAIRLLSILVGVIVAASLVLGGVQYAAAGSDPQKVSDAKSRISNTLLAFLAFAFLYAFLNFLVPGGIF